MTKRQERILVWGVLLPVTLFVWAQFPPRCTFGCGKADKLQTRLASSPEPRTLKRYTVCGIAGPCWEAVGRPLPR
jgi:hypothetical protein